MERINKKKLSKRPKYHLVSIKLAFNTSEKLNMTASSMKSQYELGFSDQDVVDIIQALKSADFYKSMPPEHPGYSAWQDVYKPIYKKIALYLKFQIDKRDAVIVSFKAR